MPWLTYEDDEVTRYHYEFECAANEALNIAGLNQQFGWVHHFRATGNSLIPDFVLQNIATRRWILALEIKRTRAAVYSTRYQMQAKGYAELNEAFYEPARPKYYAISNLEKTLLFAINGSRSPDECRLVNGIYDSGMFSPGTSAEQKRRFVDLMVALVRRVTAETDIIFDSVWPSVLSEYANISNALIGAVSTNYEEPTTENWSMVREYFGLHQSEASARIFVLRCLMVEYLRGILLRFNHPNAREILPLRRDSEGLATSIESIRTIDFKLMFDESSPAFYRMLPDSLARDQLNDYIAGITNPSRRIVDLAMTRGDVSELIESVLRTLCPVELQDGSGKIQTDPDLAAILATLTISNASNTVIDPCCGHGALLSAAYDRFQSLGLDHASTLSAICGIEADPIAARMSSVMLALKQPAIVTSNLQINICYGDTFSNQTQIREADSILMNPPFKRYEAQDQGTVPPELRDYYNSVIENVDQIPAKTTSGQANLYNYYVEYVIKLAQNGACLGIILDNRWYHNKYGKTLRQFILNNCEIVGLFEYPHQSFFSNWAIATSIIVLKKVENVSPNNKVQFVRCCVDPRGVSLSALSDALYSGSQWPIDWKARSVPQTCLNSENGWKVNFSNGLTQDFRALRWPFLSQLFRLTRRGSLAKEGGGVQVYEFPFDRRDYGPRRLPASRRLGGSFSTNIGRVLTSDENRRLVEYAANIPNEFRGWAINNADDILNYELSVEDVTRQQTLEPPSMRGSLPFTATRLPWDQRLEVALREIYQNPLVFQFIEAIEKMVNLNQNVLPKEKIWNVLREPISGELIIPRKMREGHRVHINPFAFNLTGRQVRISSNFITYANCIAVDEQSSLDRATSSKLIAAFLISSFGQLQFEMEGHNREGCLSLEVYQLERVQIFDPRWIRPESRNKILQVFQALPYPIRTNRFSNAQGERNLLDSLFAEEICAHFTQLDPSLLLRETHAMLDEWLLARQP